jgi:hypothetical protein
LTRDSKRVLKEKMRWERGEGEMRRGNKRGRGERGMKRERESPGVTLRVD